MADRAHRLSDLLGIAVLDDTGRRLGYLVDLAVRIGEGDPTVERALVGSRRSGTPRRAVPWESVTALGDDTMVVLSAASASIETTGVSLAPDELLLGRDVLDTQIVDLDGRRLVRVADVVVHEAVDGQLSTIGVDTGFDAVVRRVGFHRLAGWLAARHADQHVPWSALHLTSARGHMVQLATPAAALHSRSPDDIGVVLDAVSTGAGVDIVRRVHPDRATAALAASHPRTIHRIDRALHAGSAVPRRRMRRHDGWRRRVPTRPSSR